jgi:hypothetical protein
MLTDWFEDPAILSDWLIEQQEHMVLGQPMEVSPFASFSEDRGYAIDTISNAKKVDKPQQ